jgi:hypothetical protein
VSKYTSAASADAKKEEQSILSMSGLLLLIANLSELVTNAAIVN